MVSGPHPPLPASGERSSDAKHRPGEGRTSPASSRIPCPSSGHADAPLDVSPLERGQETIARARAALADVVDPEIPVLTIADLGVLRDVALENGRVVVTVTPTYSGCPAMSTITLDIGLALERAGIADAVVRTVLSPAWTTDWMTESGRDKLHAYGIAPPVRGGGRRALFGVESVACPQCGSADTERVAEFGSTSCKALWRCRACREPFDYFRCH